MKLKRIYLRLIGNPIITSQFRDNLYIVNVCAGDVTPRYTATWRVTQWEPVQCRRRNLFAESAPTFINPAAVPYAARGGGGVGNRLIKIPKQNRGRSLLKDDVSAREKPVLINSREKLGESCACAALPPRVVCNRPPDLVSRYEWTFTHSLTHNRRLVGAGCCDQLAARRCPHSSCRFHNLIFVNVLSVAADCTALCVWERQH